jgi:ribonuclease HIII
VSESLWPIIGVDESGKGDFFGPLVIAGVLVAEEELPIVSDIGVRDSKTISDGKIVGLAERIKKSFTHNLVVINPEKYNELYNKIRNLNKLLGWGHARVIENILAEKPAIAAISDKFGHDHFISDRLQKEGRKIELIQRVRGEAHPAVAAASILARAEFIWRMNSMSKKFSVSFPKGASAAVDEAGRKLVRSEGKEILGSVAKLHFKNYKKIFA